MGWDKTLPASDQKLRTLAATITNGWEAIEEGDEVSGTPLAQRAILLADRTDVATAADPVVVGATTYLYSKQDNEDGSQELFVRDAASNVLQMTNDGKIGRDTVNFEMNSISFDNASAITYNEDNMVKAWAVVTASTGVFVGKGFDTVVRNSSGRHTLTLEANVVSNANFLVMATIEYDSSSEAVIAYETLAYDAGTFKGSFKTRVVNKNNLATERNFTVMIMGT